MATGGLSVLVAEDDLSLSPPAPAPAVSDQAPNSCSKRKLDELFYYWLSLEETKTLITSLVDDVKAGKPLPRVDNQSSTPLSPVSKLLKSNQDMVAPWSPGRGQPSTPPRSPSARRSFSRVAVKDTLPPVSPRATAASQQSHMQSELIPRFFFPKMAPSMAAIEEQRMRVAIDELFSTNGESAELALEQLQPLTVQVAGLPSFMNSKLFEQLVDKSAMQMDGSAHPRITKDNFLAFWETELKDADTATRIFNTLKQRGAQHVVPKDWLPLMHELLETHVGLEFLRETKEFQARYAETVIARIFFRLDRHHLGRITLKDMEKSSLVAAMLLVDSDDDINKELQFFSYEHFYVLYCKFWELDTDHDLEINRDQLLRYGNHALTRRLVDRIFTQEPWPFSCRTPNRMGYHDFVWFALCEEDKTNDVSLEFWFRCIDTDNDGVISAYEMEHFYREQLYRMHCLNVEAVSFADLLCQLNDMIKPKMEAIFTLADFKKPLARPNAGHFFNALGNLNKFVGHETRDPYSIRQERATPHLTDWDRFAQIEYGRLAAEEEAEEAEFDLDSEGEELLGLPDFSASLAGGLGAGDAPASGGNGAAAAECPF